MSVFNKFSKIFFRWLCFIPNKSENLESVCPVLQLEGKILFWPKKIFNLTAESQGYVTSFLHSVQQDGGGGTQQQGGINLKLPERKSCCKSVMYPKASNKAKGYQKVLL